MNHLSLFMKHTLYGHSFFLGIRVDALRDAWLSRWDWFHRPIHAMAHILHPLWRDEKQYDNEELEEGWKTYIEAFTEGDVQKIKQLEHERLLFRNGTGRSFNSATARLRECQLEPVSWWEKYGISAPNLVRQSPLSSFKNQCIVHIVQ